MIESYREVVRLDPDSAGALIQLGDALLDARRPEGAIESYRQAIRLDPKNARAHAELGSALSGAGDLAGAIDSFREAARLDPDSVYAHYFLGSALEKAGDQAGAIESYRKATSLGSVAIAAYSLGTGVRNSGDFEGAIAPLREAIRLNPDHAEAYCNLGQTYLWNGQPELGLPLIKRGHELGSRRPDWKYPSAKWVWEAEQAIEIDNNLPEILARRDQPGFAAEAGELVEVAYYSKFHVASARLAEAAFAADPGLAADRSNWLRYNAACSAALAAAGKGKDGPMPDAEAKARFRRQALDWLRAELAAWSEVLDRKDLDAKTRAEVVATLEHWQADPDLAGVREADALAGLPEAERAEWKALWEEVDGLLGKVGGG